MWCTHVVVSKHRNVLRGVVYQRSLCRYRYRYWCRCRSAGAGPAGLWQAAESSITQLHNHTDTHMLPLLVVAALSPVVLISCQPQALELRSARCLSTWTPELRTPLTATAKPNGDGRLDTMRVRRGAPVPLRMAVAKTVSGRHIERRRRLSKEALVAKGLASAALLRLAYYSRACALAASLMLPVVIVSPVIAIEAILLTVVLCACGVASYWPANVGVFALGTAGVAGCLNGVIVFWEGRKQRRREAIAARRSGRRVAARGERASRSSQKPRDAQEETVPDDGSGGLVVLLISALTAAIVGALP